MGFLENLFGTNPEFTVTNNKTGKEVQARDARELERYAAREQDKDPDKPADFFQRLFSR